MNTKRQTGKGNNRKVVHMKKSMLMILLVFGLAFGLAANAMAAGSGEVVDSYRIKVSLLNQDPDPVNQGNFVDLRFKFENYGLREAENIEVRLPDQGPFSMVREADRLQEVGTLTGRQTEVDGKVIKYRVNVANNAGEGDYDVNIQYRIDGGAWQEPSPFTVTVRQTRPQLAVLKAVTEPGRVVPGQDATLTLTLENMAEKDFKDVRVTFQVVSFTTTTTTISKEELPFSPLGTTNELIVGTMPRRSQKEVAFSFTTDPTADITVYKLPVLISYADYFGNNYSTTQYTTIVLEAKPELSVTVDSSDLSKPGQKGDITLKFVNRGIEDIKFLTADLHDDDHLTVLSSNEVYVGNIDSDDYETADFTVYLKDGCCEDGTFSLPLSIRFRDGSNRAYADEPKDVNLRIYTEEQQERFGIQQSSSSVGIIIVVLIVVLGLFVYLYLRRRKKKKK
ncbi:MAG: hypothetical protein GXP63_06415 [DPANN group archaeon]|nr:hypothetical protein [DPANN group archaeon]